MTPREVAEVATGYLGAFASGDPDVIAACVTDDFVNEHTSATGRGCVGRDAYRERLAGFLRDFAGLHYDVEEVIAEGAQVAVAYIMRAAGKGHAHIAVRGVFRLRVEGGLIAHRADYWDGTEFLRQTGQA